MKYYKEVILAEPDASAREMLIAQLSQLGYDGFEEDGDTLKAYIGNDEFDGPALDAVVGEKHLGFRVNTIQERNWNAEWESSFSPVQVEGRVAVRAHFHAPVEGVEHEIVITPKMSFGTGHHATTWLMMKHILDLDLRNKDVLDLGTGTGVLAILAEQRGAGEVLAIDNDPWSVDNAQENLSMNNSRVITVQLDSKMPVGRDFDVILANINKHILLEFCDAISAGLRPGGVLLLSGILKDDLADISAAYSRLLGLEKAVEEKNNWLVVAFTKATG